MGHWNVLAYNPFTKKEEHILAKDDLIDVQGTITAVHSGGLYRVQCDSGHELLAQLSGRMRRFRIKVVPGDRVKVGVSPYDPTLGLITFRERYVGPMFETTVHATGNPHHCLNPRQDVHPTAEDFGSEISVD